MWRIRILRAVGGRVLILQLFWLPTGVHATYLLLTRPFDEINWLPWPIGDLFYLPPGTGVASLSIYDIISRLRARSGHSAVVPAIGVDVPPIVAPQSPLPGSAGGGVMPGPNGGVPADLLPRITVDELLVEAAAQTTEAAITPPLSTTPARQPISEPPPRWALQPRYKGRFEARIRALEVGFDPPFGVIGGEPIRPRPFPLATGQPGPAGDWNQLLARGRLQVLLERVGQGVATLREQIEAERLAAQLVGRPPRLEALPPLTAGHRGAAISPADAADRFFRAPNGSEQGLLDQQAAAFAEVDAALAVERAERLAANAALVERLRAEVLAFDAAHPLPGRPPVPGSPNVAPSPSPGASGLSLPAIGTPPPEPVFGRLPAGVDPVEPLWLRILRRVNTRAGERLIERPAVIRRFLTTGNDAILLREFGNAAMQEATNAAGRGVGRTGRAALGFLEPLAMASMSVELQQDLRGPEPFPERALETAGAFSRMMLLDFAGLRRQREARAARQGRSGIVGAFGPEAMRLVPHVVAGLALGRDLAEAALAELAMAEWAASPEGIAWLAAEQQLAADLAAEQELLSLADALRRQRETVIAGQFAEWPGQSSFGFFLPFSSPSLLEESEMSTIYKGTIDFNSVGWGGWSESVYSDVSTETSATMMAKMKGLLVRRMTLSQGPDSVATNPVVPFSIRVEDELINRDAYTVYCIAPGGPPIAGGFQIPTPSFSPNPATTGLNNNNLDMQLGARIKFTSGASAQVASPMFHGVPIFGLASQATAQPNTSTSRQAPPNDALLSNYAGMTLYMARNGLGYRNIAGAWNGAGNVPGPSSAPMDWVYNESQQMVELQWKAAQFPGVTFPITPTSPVLTVPPYYPTALVLQASSTWPQINSKCHLQIRGWKNFPVLNGRFAAQIVAPYSSATIPNPYSPNVGPYQFALRILHKVRQPTDSSVPFVSPIAWAYWWPGEALVTPGGPFDVLPPTFTQPGGYANQSDWMRAMGQWQYIQSKKLGRIFGSERGRQRNRAS